MSDTHPNKSLICNSVSADDQPPCLSGTLWLGNAAYLYLSVSFIQMLKALMPVAVFCSGCAFGIETFSLGTLANMVCKTPRNSNAGLAKPAPETRLKRFSRALRHACTACLHLERATACQCSNLRLCRIHDWLASFLHAML